VIEADLYFVSSPLGVYELSNRVSAPAALPPIEPASILPFPSLTTTVYFLETIDGG